MTDTNQTEWTDEEIARQIETFAPVEQLRAETEPRAISARYDRDSGLVFIQLKTGATISFPARSYRWLKEATEEENCPRVVPIPDRFIDMLSGDVHFFGRSL
jgi:hypothetical protein